MSLQTTAASSLPTFQHETKSQLFRQSYLVLSPMIDSSTVSVRCVTLFALIFIIIMLLHSQGLIIIINIINEYD